MCPVPNRRLAARNGDSARLAAVLELAVTPTRSHKIPTVLAQHAQYVRYFHRRSRLPRMKSDA
jgi:hypothetical protein